MLDSGRQAIETDPARFQRIVQSLQTAIYAGDFFRYNLQLLSVIPGKAIHFLIDQMGKLLQILFGQDMLLYLAYYQPFKFAAVEVAGSTGAGSSLEQSATYIVAEFASFSFLSDQSFAAVPASGKPT